jgi:lipopolysaccharide assembly outer membrane protein LptD (OstA)
VGYDYHVASASLVRQLTPRVQGTLSAGYSSFLPDTDFDSDTLSLQAGLTTNFSESLVASFLAGQRQTTSDSTIITGFCIGGGINASWPSCLPNGTPSLPISIKTEVETTSPVFSASLTKTLETGSLSASLSRSSSPSSDGELLDATRLILAGDYKHTETLSSSLKIEYTENETIVNQAGVLSQDTEEFFRVTPRVSWRWRREWTFAGEYQYARNDDVNRPKATRNAVYVTVSYRPPKRSISR